MSLLSSVSSAQAIFVDALKDPALPQTGTDWNEAYISLSDALADSRINPGSGGTIQEVWVARGLYTPTPVVGQPELSTFTIPRGIRVYGGFTSGLTHLDQRVDNDKRRTILSGALNTPNNDNAFHVVTIAVQQGGAKTVLDGMTIRDGQADDQNSVHNQRGGGIYCVEAHLVLDRVFVQSNTALGNGGGLYFDGDLNKGHLSVYNCEFRTNVAGLKGGGAHVTAMFEGGASGGNLQFSHIYNSVFDRNLSTGGGGALSVGQRFEPNEFVVCNSIFKSNLTRGQGAAIHASDPSDQGGIMRIVHCTITQNAMMVQGQDAQGNLLPGSIVEGGGNGLFYNNVVYGNSYFQNIGVLPAGTPFNPSNYAVLAPAGGGGFTGWHVAFSDVESRRVADAQGNVTLTPYPGNGNINRDPVFVSQFDLHLTDASPCLDAGTTTLQIGITGTDLPGDLPDIDNDGDFVETIWYAFDPTMNRLIDIPGVGSCVNPGSSTCAENDMGCYEHL